MLHRGKAGVAGRRQAPGLPAQARVQAQDAKQVRVMALAVVPVYIWNQSAETLPYMFCTLFPVSRGSVLRLQST
ncbi:hypothetical protein DDE05_26530 [Streptomyces cavourensis]|nr:hypothetical protein DDE05_26530 [Streptomyces cavourensis]